MLPTQVRRSSEILHPQDEVTAAARRCPGAAARSRDAAAIAGKRSGLPSRLCWGALLCLGAVLSAAPCYGQPPKRLGNSEIQRLKDSGDRQADQGNYQAALEDYTLAFTGVVARIRGQDFSEPIKPSLFTREELGVEMQRMLEKEMTSDELALMDGSLKVLGFVSAETSPSEVYTNLLTEQVAGFYDPDDKRMVLIVEAPPKKEMGWLAKLLGGETFNKDEQKTTLAHELTHALQDQLYDLNAMEKGIEKDDDMLLAFSALVEGDATLLMFCEMQGEPNVKDMDPAAMRATFNIMSWLLPLSAGESYRTAPPIFRDSLTFPYFQGMLFVMSRAGTQGWPGVHALYADPPLSTEQILHPKKYQRGADYDPPVAIQFPDLAKTMGKKWKSLGGSCLGELQTSILLKKVPGGSNAARGWDGDYYEVFQNGAGHLAIAYASVWDSEQDAAEFANAYCRYRGIEPFDSAATSGTTQAAIKPTGTQPTASEAATPVFAKRASRVVELDGDKVWIVEGFGAKQRDKVLEAIKRSEIVPKVFPQPAPAE